MRVFSGEKLFSCVFVLILSFIFTLLPTSANAAHPRIVKVGAQDNPPFIYKDEDGRFRGLSVDVLEQIALREDWRLQYVSCVFSKCLEMLEIGQIDIQAVIAFSEKRAKTFDFANETLFSNWGRIYTGLATDIESILDLRDKKIAITKRGIHSKAFRELMMTFGFGFEEVVVKDYATVFEMVHNKRADAGVVSRAFGEVRAKDFHMRQSSIVFSPVELRVAVPRGVNSDILSILDKHLALLKEDPGSVYYRSLDHWFGDDGAAGGLPHWVKWTMLSAIGVFFILSGTSLMFRYQVGQKTKELSRQNILLASEIEERRQAEASLQEHTRKLELSVADTLIADEQLKESLRDKEVLLQEVHHRVKNNLAVISALHSMQESHIKDVEAKRAFKDSRNRIRSMALVHERLYQSDNLARIRVDEYLKSLVLNLYQSFATPGRTINIQVATDKGLDLDIDTLIPCGLIVTELVSNALKYAFEDRDSGNMEVGLKAEGAKMVLWVKDDGIGMPEGVDIEASDSLGMKIVSSLVNQLEGELEVIGSGGTKIRITFTATDSEA